MHADYPILADPAKTVATAYGVVTATRPVAYRWTFYIGPDGKILYVDKADQHRNGRRGYREAAGGTGSEETHGLIGLSGSGAG